LRVRKDRQTGPRCQVLSLRRTGKWTGPGGGWGGEGGWVGGGSRWVKRESGMSGKQTGFGRTVTIESWRSIPSWDENVTGGSQRISQERNKKGVDADSIFGLSRDGTGCVTPGKGSQVKRVNDQDSKSGRLREGVQGQDGRGQIAFVEKGGGRKRCAEGKPSGAKKKGNRGGISLK